MPFDLSTRRGTSVDDFKEEDFCFVFDFLCEDLRPTIHIIVILGMEMADKLWAQRINESGWRTVHCAVCSL